MKVSLKKTSVLLNDQVIGSFCFPSSAVFEADILDIRGRKLAVLAKSKKALVKALTAEVQFLLENVSFLNQEHPVRKALGEKFLQGA
jgi:hypothetical protein